MDERTRFFLCVLAGVGGFGGLLALFGGLVGVVARREGRGGGTMIGLGAAQAFERQAGRELSPWLRVGLVGAIDGLVFGSGVGLAVGVYAARRFPADWQTLRGGLLAMTALVLLAVGLGLLAGWATRR